VIQVDIVAHPHTRARGMASQRSDCVFWSIVVGCSAVLLPAVFRVLGEGSSLGEVEPVESPPRSLAEALVAQLFTLLSLAGFGLLVLGCALTAHSLYQGWELRLEAEWLRRLEEDYIVTPRGSAAAPAASSSGLPAFYFLSDNWTERRDGVAEAQQAAAAADVGKLRHSPPGSLAGMMASAYIPVVEGEAVASPATVPICPMPAEIMRSEWGVPDAVATEAGMIVEYVTRDFIDTWYLESLTGDREFRDQVRATVSSVIGALLARGSQLDVVTWLIDDALPLVKDHVALYREAFAKAGHQRPELFRMNPVGQLLRRARARRSQRAALRKELQRAVRTGTKPSKDRPLDYWGHDHEPIRAQSAEADPDTFALLGPDETTVEQSMATCLSALVLADTDIRSRLHPAAQCALPAGVDQEHPLQAGRASSPLMDLAAVGLPGATVKPSSAHTVAASQVAYLRKQCPRLLATIVPGEEMGSPLLGLLLREIVTGAVLQPALDSLSCDLVNTLLLGLINPEDYAYKRSYNETDPLEGVKPPTLATAASSQSSDSRTRADSDSVPPMSVAGESSPALRRQASAPASVNNQEAAPPLGGQSSASISSEGSFHPRIAAPSMQGRAVSDRSLAASSPLPQEPATATIEPAAITETTTASSVVPVLSDEQLDDCDDGSSTLTDARSGVEPLTLAQLKSIAWIEDAAFDVPIHDTPFNGEARVKFLLFSVPEDTLPKIVMVHMEFPDGDGKIAVEHSAFYRDFVAGKLVWTGEISKAAASEGGPTRASHSSLLQTVYDLLGRRVKYLWVPPGKAVDICKLDDCGEGLFGSSRRRASKAQLLLLNPRDSHHPAPVSSTPAPPTTISSLLGTTSLLPAVEVAPKPSEILSHRAVSYVKKDVEADLRARKRLTHDPDPVETSPGKLARFKTDAPKPSKRIASGGAFGAAHMPLTLEHGMSLLAEDSDDLDEEAKAESAIVKDITAALASMVGRKSKRGLKQQPLSDTVQSRRDRRRQRARERLFARLQLRLTPNVLISRNILLRPQPPLIAAIERGFVSHEAEVSAKGYEQSVTRYVVHVEEPGRMRWKLQPRFSDFHATHLSLVESIAKFSIPFPPKSATRSFFGGGFKQEFIDDRCRLLRTWLTDVLNHPIACQSAEVRSLLQPRGSSKCEPVELASEGLGDALDGFSDDEADDSVDGDAQSSVLLEVAASGRLLPTASVISGVSSARPSASLDLAKHGEAEPLLSDAEYVRLTLESLRRQRKTALQFAREVSSSSCCSVFIAIRQWHQVNQWPFSQDKLGALPLDEPDEEPLLPLQSRPRAGTSTDLARRAETEPGWRPVQKRSEIHRRRHTLLPQEVHRVETVVFELAGLLMLSKRRDWMKSQLLGILRGLGRTLYTGTMAKALKQSYLDLTSVHQMAHYLELVREAVWPGGSFPETTPVRHADDELDTRDALLLALVDSMPSSAEHLFGSDALCKATFRLHGLINCPPLMRSLAYCLFDTILDRLVPPPPLLMPSSAKGHGPEVVGRKQTTGLLSKLNPFATTKRTPVPPPPQKKKPQ
jgi:hypothetical protein